MAGRDTARHDLGSDSAQPALGPVSRDSPADLAGRREADPSDLSRDCLVVIA